ncbi:signal peptidase I [Flammeovirga yaeyamensis]|uniref:Signal peptidase I n=1 Tax=Flammeovirga yaeyamensis TaxID=367791 RepID=A0AAX1ND77_9BACT|nr:signal peptidase I [Flammeovirga yaeyamensis]MBB3696603.1 signal peptidase I [Flammeovirga yaeyamensis]NMF33279.1 signal peptidase I [Flammeovirga yaeyamensis]QWG05442.1 signal peptidase I [Flammeovirga yaeyamensis]
MKKLKFILLLPAVVFFILCLLSLRAYTIAGPSMSPTLLLNELAIVNHNAYKFGQAERGDMILYFDSIKNSVAVKRLIGIPGDKIEVKENVVYINDIEQKQTFQPRENYNQIPQENGLGDIIAKENIFGQDHLITYTKGKSDKRNFTSITLNENEYFILGDHRDNSADSRFIGPIYGEQILGKVVW